VKKFAVIIFIAGCTITTQQAPLSQPTADPDPASDQLETGDREAAAAGYAGPIVCHGADDIQIVDAVIETVGDGPTVQGRCDIYIVNSRIVAGGSALVVQGNGDIRVENSIIQGDRAAAVVQGNGDISAEGTQFIGPIFIQGNGGISAGNSTFDHEPVIDGNGDFTDNGGNSWPE